MVVWNNIVKHSLALLAVTLLLGLSWLLFPVKGSTQPTDAETWVDAFFDITFINGTFLDVNIKLNAHKIKIFDKSYNASEIRTRYDEDGAAFKLVLYNYIESLLDDSVFPHCENEIGRPYVDEDSLLQTSGSPYDPIVFYMDCNISLTTAFFDVENISSIGDFVNGILDMGGSVSYSFDFVADVGWNITYNFILSEAMEAVEVEEGSLSLSGKKITWEIDNWDGNEEKTEKGRFTLKYSNPTSKFESEDIYLDISFDLREVEKTSLTCTVQITAVEVTDLVSLPSFVSDLSYVPADGVRLLVQEGLLSWETVHSKIFNPLKEEVEGSLTTSLNVSLNLLLAVNTSTTSNCSSPYDPFEMNGNPPLSSTLSDEVYLRFCNISSRAFFGFVYAGGVAQLSEEDISLGDLGYPYTAHLVLPPDVVGSCSWNKSSYLDTSVRYDAAPHYGDEKMEWYIEGELKSIDLDLASMLTGKSDVVTTVDARDSYNIYHITPPEDFKLPERISISQINADLIRVCIEENVFDEETLQNYFAHQKQLAEQHLSQTFGIPDIEGYIDDGRLAESKKWDGNVQEMDDEKPFTIPIYTHFSYKTGFKFSFIPFSFTIGNQSIVCSSIPGQKVVYRFFFPKGLDVVCNDTLNMISINRTSDGRTFIEVVFDGTEGNLTTIVSYSLKASPVFVVLTFLPCIIGMVVLIVLVAVVVVIRRKRRRAVPVYKEEDFVPPPSQK